MGGLERGEIMKPRENNPDSLRGAVNEVISAISALHMPHEEREQGDNPDYLVHTSKWAHHAHEHLQQALQYLDLLERDRVLSKARHAHSIEEKFFQEQRGRLWKENG